MCVCARVCEHVCVCMRTHIHMQRRGVPLRSFLCIASSFLFVCKKFLCVCFFSLFFACVFCRAFFNMSVFCFRCPSFFQRKCVLKMLIYSVKNFSLVVKERHGPYLYLPSLYEIMLRTIIVSGLDSSSKTGP